MLFGFPVSIFRDVVAPLLSPLRTVMVFNTTFNNISVISWRSLLLVEEPGVSTVNHLRVASHWQTLSHNVVLSTTRHVFYYFDDWVVTGSSENVSIWLKYHEQMKTNITTKCENKRCSWQFVYIRNLICNTVNVVLSMSLY